MDITFVGTNPLFLGDAFFDNLDSLDSIEVVSATPTQVVVQNFQNGFVTTFSGIGLSVDAEGNPSGGTITGATLVQNGVTQATIANTSWNFPAFLDALLLLEASDDASGLAALFNSDGPISVDASGAAASFNMDDFTFLSPFITQPMTVTGSDNPYDRLIGGAGNDTIILGSNDDGNDVVLATAGNDTIDFSQVGPTSFVSLRYDLEYVPGQAGSPVVFDIDGSTNTGSVSAAGFTDTLVDIANVMPWGLGLEGGTGADTFNITTGDGFFYIAGGEGIDSYVLNTDGQVRISFNYGFDSGPTDGLQINLSTGVIANDGFGNVEQVNVTGGTGRIEVRGTDNNDLITGSDRDERFITEQGNDTVDGGDGFDLIRYDRSGVEAVNVNLATGIATGTWDGVAFTDTLSNIEWVRGSRTGDDTLTGNDEANVLAGRGGNDLLDGAGGDDTLYGEEGNDTIIGGTGTDTAVIDANLDDASINLVVGGVEITTSTGTTLVMDDVEFFQFDDQTVEFTDFGPTDPPVNDTGSSGSDVIETGSGDDTITGRGGSDEISSGGGDDTVAGGVGFDTIDGGSGNDTLQGNDGYDNISGGSGDDVLIGNNGFDLLDGQGGNDTLIGGLGLDTMLGGDGEDLFLGQAGFDVLEGGSGNDTLNGNAGADTLSGDDGEDELNGGINHDVLNGGDGNDTLNGNNGSDTLFGDAGDDRLEGNAGSDTLDGGTGDDVMRGGIGADTFVFNVGSGDDRIADFQNNIDHFVLDSDLFTETTPVANDILDYASLNADGFVVLTFGMDSLTFTNITNVNALLDDISFA